MTLYDLASQADLMALGGRVGQQISALQAALAALQPAPPPAPVLPPGRWLHEPPGFTPLLNQPWVTGIPPMSGGFPGNHALVSDQPGALVSPPTALDVIFPQGLAGGNEEFGKYWYLIPSARVAKAIFIGFTFKYSPTWQGHSSGVNKLLWVSAHGWGKNDFWIEASGSGSGPMGLQVVTEFAGIFAQQYAPNVTAYFATPVAGETAVTVSRGAWHTCEAYLELPAVSGAPGIVRIWIDGVLGLNRDATTAPGSQVLMTYSGNGWAEVDVDPIWGGVGDVKAQRDDLWYDHLYISGP